MKSMRRFGIAALLLSLVLFALPAARAGVWNHSTKVTFNTSVQLPGVVLPPGEYRFQLLDSLSNRHVVQVFNAEHSHVFGTFLTVPAYRLEPSGKTIFVMEERPLGEPEAIKEWYYPGELIGEEFIYSRSTSPVFASAVQPAATTPEEMPAESPVATTPTETESTVHSEDVVPTESTEPVVTQEPQAPPPETQSPEPAKKSEEPAKAEELPQTASNLYLVLLVGGLLVMSGAAIRRFAKC